MNNSSSGVDLSKEPVSAPVQSQNTTVQSQNTAPTPIQQQDTTIAPAGTIFCKFCGTRIPAQAIICTHCGCQVSEIQQQAAAQPQQIVINNSNNNSNVNNVGALGIRAKNKWVSFLLCLLLGGFGAHKFYEGKIGMGILYLLTGGLFVVGVIVDLIVILCKPNPYYV